MALGILISVLSKTKTEANQYFFGILIVFTLLSGMFIPIDSMPWYLQILANILPLGHGSPLLNQVITKGVPLSMDNFHMQYILGFIGGCIVLSYIIFARKQYEV
jgi:ABC-2 type transport system permease protein